MIDVSILIVTWNSARDIGGCLAGIQRETVCRYEVIVVDNASADGTAELVAEGFPWVTVVRSPGNLGFAAGNNLALRHARGRYVFLVNPDTVFLNDVAGELMRAYEALEGAGAVGPRIFERDGSECAFAARPLPGLTDIAMTQFGLRKLLTMGAKKRLFEPEISATEPTEAPCLTGAAILLEREFFVAMGGLDETIPMYYEDVALCAEVARRGRRLYHVPGAVLRHLGGRSADLSPVRPLLLALEKGQAPWLYFREYRGGGAAAAFTLVMAAGSVFRLVAAGLLWMAGIVRGAEARRRAGVHFGRAWTLLGWALSDKDRVSVRARAAFAPAATMGDSMQDKAEAPATGTGV